jgi:hypothetical protein
LTALAEPGFFTIDEQNHLAMVVSYRHGRLTLPGLDGLTPSQELAFFDPTRPSPPTSPPLQDLPPLYGVIALPFAVFGLGGLIALNTLAFLAVAALVFAHARRHATGAGTPWLAAGAFLFASHTMEYALGVWPHATSVLLCTGAFVLAERARARDALRLAAFAGLCAGVAAGVRYPNAVYGACILATLWLWAPRRWETAVAFMFAAAVPLATSSVLNHMRFGSWNPIAKRSSYLVLGGGSSDGTQTETIGRLADWGLSFWSRVVDDAARPAAVSRAMALTLEPESGAFTVYGVVKKAWLQSSPWVALALCAVALAWWPGAATADGPRRREMRACSVPIAGVLVAFALAGVARSDGMSFNARYLLDLVPLAAVLFAWALDGARLPVRSVVAASAIGALAGGWVLAVLGLAERASCERWVPLVLAALLVFAFVLRAWPPGRAALALLLGASLGWSAAIHLGHDVRVSLDRRREVARMRADLPGRLPAHAAVLTWGIYRSVVAAEQLQHDLVILDCARDRGRDAMTLASQLLRRGRRVFILANGFPADLRSALTRRFGEGRWDRGKVTFVELRLPASEGGNPPGG